MVTAVAALGTFTLRLTAAESPKLSSLALSFALFWIGSFAVCALYFTFIYPFYVSPSRHLPTVGGRHWLMGHAPELYYAAPGECSRKWYVSRML